MPPHSIMGDNKNPHGEHGELAFAEEKKRKEEVQPQSAASQYIA